MTNPIETNDVLNMRNITDRVEELEGIIAEDMEDPDQDALTMKARMMPDNEEAKEYLTLVDLLDDVRGCGGDHQWRGDWYPLTLIRDDYFADYAEELVSDIGDLPSKMPNYIVIDWEATARNIQQDYTSTSFDGVTYWYR